MPWITDVKDSNKFYDLIYFRCTTMLDAIRPLVQAKGLDKFYVAGNSLNSPLDKVNDVDVFPVGTPKITCPDGWNLLIKTRNASTYQNEKTGLKVQICEYYHPTLQSLVDSFDFAHIQIGVEFEASRAWPVKEIYYSSNYELARLMGDSFFTGSEYPLSSLVRLGKYYKRGQISDAQHMVAVLGILAAIVERGYMDEYDFADQFEAIDPTTVIDALGAGEYVNTIINVLSKLPKFDDIDWTE